jgi:hypothetical protein
MPSYCKPTEEANLSARYDIIFNFHKQLSLWIKVACFKKAYRHTQFQCYTLLFHLIYFTCISLNVLRSVNVSSVLHFVLSVQTYSQLTWTKTKFERTFSVLTSHGKLHRNVFGDFGDEMCKRTTDGYVTYQFPITSRSECTEGIKRFHMSAEAHSTIVCSIPCRRHHHHRPAHISYKFRIHLQTLD